MLRSLVRPLAAVLVTAAAGLVVVGGTATPAQAASCTSSQGVTVVVSFNQLDGDDIASCAGSSGKASDLFRAVGVELGRVRPQPGAVCTVQAKPGPAACNAMPPADKYWSLWWSDGKSSSWVYSSLGVDSLNVPEGGSVAFSWNEGRGQVEPSTSAPVQAAPTPTPAPETGTGSGSGEGRGNGSRGDDGSRGDGGSRSDTTDGGSRGDADAPATDEPTDDSSDDAGDPAATPSAKADRARGDRRRGAKGDRRDRAEASESPSADASESASADASEPAEESSDPQTTASPPAPDGGLPGWVAPGVVVLLFAAAGGALVLRRRGTPHP